MKPSQAIRSECRFCLGTVKGAKCESVICKLNDKFLSALKRIKFHCLECVESKREVKDCAGDLLSEERLCYLYLYRMGTNPQRKGIGNRKPSLEGLEFYRKQRTHGMVLRSKNATECVGVV